MREENGTDGKKIAVIDSLSASAGELNIALFIRDLCEKGLPFEEICRQTEAYRDSMNTYFVIETLDFLKKNGRLTGLTAFIASALNIKPVMGADSGTIIKVRSGARHDPGARPDGGDCVQRGRRYRKQTSGDRTL